MTKKLILSYQSQCNRLFKIYVDDNETIFIKNVSENFTNEIEQWKNPDLDIALLLALYPIKKLNKIIENFDIDYNALDYTLSYLNDTGTSEQIENYFKNLKIVTAANAGTDTNIKYFLDDNKYKRTVKTYDIQN
jgi:hypothetical protein